MGELLANSLSRILTMVGFSFLLPMAVAWRYGEWKSISDFAIPFAAILLLAVAFKARKRRPAARVRGQSAFAIVGGTWIAISLFGAIPLWLGGAFPTFSDAVFESVSGFTTTGATVLGDVEALPRSVNFWRCQMHWLGGMGVIALAVALMPVIGINGFSLVKAESSGPEKGKLTTRIADTAKVLWGIYFAMTVVQASLLHWAGMGWFDATCHAFSTMGTGGFSTRNGSVGAFANPAAEWICTAFMLLAAVNFSCYFMLVKGRFRDFFDHSELRGFIVIVALAAAGCSLACWRQTGCLQKSVRDATFQVASIISTTGFMTSDYTQWLPFAQLLILLLFFVGGCSGSTAGGVKVIRWVVLWKQLKNEMSRLLHPHGVYTMRIDGAPSREGIVPVVSSFVFVYFAMVLVTTLFAAAFGIDPATALSSSLSMVGNVGPAFGSLGPTSNYGDLPTAVKWMYSFAMLAGRLEIYTLLILVGQMTLRKNSSSSPVSA